VTKGHATSLLRWPRWRSHLVHRRWRPRSPSLSPTLYGA